jgi:hypothetical protein
MPILVLPWPHKLIDTSACTTKHVPCIRGIYLTRKWLINDNAKKSKIPALVRLDQLESVESASAIMFMHGQLGAATT